ncbi:hypothetical protein [Cellulomonas sp. NPDC089187]|uniref:hypothetical protein n=1 Tax=Cellulomonas sp. NPDC089187 TaxID=3154970 RepID=UPI0034389CED
MKIRTVRAGGALIAALLVAPIGAGVAAAEVAPEPATATAETAEVATEAPAEESTTPADEATTPADDATTPVDETTPAEEETPAEEPTTPVDEVATPAETTPAEGSEVTEAAAPVDVEINGLLVEGYIEPAEQFWHTSGEYSALLTISDVIGVGVVDGTITQFPGMTADVTFVYTVNGGTEIPFTPAADGTFLIEGLAEGENTIGVRASYQNTVGSTLVASAVQSVTSTVLTRAETVDLVWTDTAASGAYEDTRYQGESITIINSGFDANEQVTVYLFAADGSIADTLTATADASGGLTYTYAVPAGMNPADYLLYFEGATSGTVSSFLLHVLAGTVVDPGNAGTVTAAPAAPTQGTGTLTELATTGSESSHGLLIGSLATVAGLGLAVGARSLRSRLTARD